MNNITIFIVASVVCFLLLKILYPVAIKVHLVDAPDERKQHEGEIPLIGGIAMFFAFAVALLGSKVEINQVYGDIIAVTIVVLVGVFDDRRHISVRLRFFLQSIAVLLMAVFSNKYVSNLGDIVGVGTIALESFAIPFTIIAVVGSMNATNMIDGVDGLAASTAIVCFLAVIVLSLLQGQTDIKPILYVAVLVPFLFNNLSKDKKIFMGDSGSMFLGFGVAWVLTDATQGELSIMSPVTAVWFFAIPLIDMWAIMYRRIRKGQSPFMPDRNHLHHIFLRAGLSHRATLGTITLLAAACAGIGIMGEINHIPEWIMFVAFMLVLLLYMWSIRHVWTILKIIRHQEDNEHREISLKN